MIFGRDILAVISQALACPLTNLLMNVLLGIFIEKLFIVIVTSSLQQAELPERSLLELQSTFKNTQCPAALSSCPKRALTAEASPGQELCSRYVPLTPAWLSL